MRASPAVAFLAFAAAVASLSGCGTTPQPPTAGPDAGVAELEAYFGLQKGRCFEYTTGDTKALAPDLGVAVEELSNQFSVPTRVIVYRTAGVAMRDFVAFDAGDLKLYKREFPGGKSFIYNPPITLLHYPLKAGDTVNSKGVASVRDQAGKLLVDPPEEHSLRVDVLEPGDVTLPAGKTVSGSKLIYSETPSVNRKEVRTFVPGTGDAKAIDGFVKFDFNFETDESKPNLIFKLQAVRDLGADPAKAVPPCGLVQ